MAEAGKRKRASEAHDEAHDDGDAIDPAILAMDLREVEAKVEARDGDGEREMLLVLCDGVSRIEMTGGLAGRNRDSIWGAQRVAAAALDYAAGVALLCLDDDS